jgi:hypothetical protein
MEQKEILEKLARKEITREQAEEMFAELGTPIPEEPPAALASKGKVGPGCLVAILLTILAGLVIPVLLAVFFYVERDSCIMREEAVRMEMDHDRRRMQREMSTDPTTIEAQTTTQEGGAE